MGICIRVAYACNNKFAINGRAQLCAALIHITLECPASVAQGQELHACTITAVYCALKPSVCVCLCVCVCVCTFTAVYCGFGAKCARVGTAPALGAECAGTHSSGKQEDGNQGCGLLCG